MDYCIFENAREYQHASTEASAILSTLSVFVVVNQSVKLCNVSCASLITAVTVMMQTPDQN